MVGLRSVLLIFVLVVVGCDDLVACMEEEESGASAGVEGRCEDISGAWRVTTEIDKSDCGEGDATEKYTLEFEQSGCRVSVVVSLLGEELRGEMKGNTVQLEGTYTSLGKIEKKLDLTFKEGRLTGTGAWTYKAPGYSCRGRESLKGQRK